MAYKFDRFGTTVLPNYEAQQDIGTGAARLAFYRLARGGRYDGLGAEDAPREGGTIVKPCTLHDESEAALKTQFNTLRALVGTRAQLWREWYADGVREWCWARVRRIQGTRKPGDTFALDLVLTFELLTGTWYSETAQALDYVDAGIDGDELPATGAESEAVITLSHVEHLGNVDQPDVKFTIASMDAALTAITVHNTTTGHAFTYAGRVAVGDRLVVDCGAAAVTDEGVDDYAGFTPPMDKNEWMRLQPGVNILEFTLTGAAWVEIEVEFYDAWA